LENENVNNVEESKPKQRKKKGKIAQVYKLHQKGVSVKEIAEKMKLSERIVRAYVWRAKNPEKFKALVQRYFAKKRRRQEDKEVKLAVRNAKKSEQEESH